MNDVNPYQTPGSVVSGPGSGPPPTPGVWIGYVVYCVFMALLYGALVAGGIAFTVFVPSSDVAAAEAVVIIVLMVGVGFVFFVPYAAAPFLPKKPWTWILGIVLIGLGLTSCLTLPFCIPLLLYWFKPENQAFFGKAIKDQMPPRESEYLS